jgi:hypothetical protein
MTAVKPLAMLACALQDRIATWVDDLSGCWLQELGLTECMVNLAAGQRRGRLNTLLFLRCCGPLPPLDRAARDAGPLALLTAEPLRARMCALALLGRPGALRHCVQREARMAFEQWLGPAFAALRAASDSGHVYHRSDLQAWSPMVWAWTGYQDLVAARAWPHPSLQRLARMAFPVSEAGLPTAIQMPALATTASEQLRRLRALYGPPLAC